MNIVVSEKCAPPRHAFELSIKIGGDDWDYVLRSIRELAVHLENCGPDCGMSSGGCGGSHSVDIQKRDVAPEQYHRELMIWAGHLSADDVPVEGQVS